MILKIKNYINFLLNILLLLILYYIINYDFYPNENMNNINNINYWIFPDFNKNLNNFNFNTKRQILK